MVTVTLDEITLNAVKAALDERIAQLDKAVVRWNQLNEHLPTEDTGRALVWNIAALLETKMAREYLGDPEVLVDHPADETWTDRESQPEFNGAFR